jgi:hypothetical protein
VGHWARRIGGGASSAVAVRRRPRKLGLRRAGSLGRPTRGCASSVCARRGPGRAQADRKVDGVMSSPRRPQWRAAELSGGARALEAGPRNGLYTRGRSVRASGVTPVTHARVERVTAWPAMCAAPAANGVPRAVRRPVDWCHLARPRPRAARVSSFYRSAVTDGRSGASACEADAGTTRTAACRRGRARHRGRERSGVPGCLQFADAVFKHVFLQILKPNRAFH